MRLESARERASASAHPGDADLTPPPEQLPDAPLEDQARDARDAIHRPAIKRLLWLIGLTVFVSHAYFYNGAQWNHNARLDAIYAFVEPGQPESGSFRIDRFISDAKRGINTGDWAQYEGHYYSNKAPGTIWLGVPAYFVLYWLERGVGVEPTSTVATLLNAYAIHVAATVFWVALSAPFFLLLIVRLSGSWMTAWALTLALYWGSLLFPFSTQLWGHPSAAAFVALGLFALSCQTQGALFLAGVCLGMAVACDYLGAVVAAVALLVVTLIYRTRGVLALVAGGALPALLLAAYHWACFGTPFTTASAHSNPEFLIDGQLGGLFGAVSLEALWGITFSSYRGLFFFCPVLLLALPGALLARDAAGSASIVRKVAWLSVIGMLLVNASFNGWHGGSSAGPRYQILALPAYALLLSGLPAKKPWHYAFWVSLALSASNMLITALTAPATPQAWRAPLEQLYALGFEMLLTGQDLTHRWKMPVASVSADAPELTSLASFNLGQQLGLSGLTSALPWLAWVVGCLLLSLHMVRRLPSPSALAPSEGPSGAA